MNELITRAIEDNETHFLAEFPPELMSESQAEMVGFVLDYVRKHKKPPTVGRMIEKFPLFTPFVFSPAIWDEEPRPLSDVFDLTVQLSLYEFTERKLQLIKTRMEDSRAVPLEILREIEQIHTMSLGVSRYSTFDRDTYFRRTTEHIPFKIIDKHIGGMASGDYLLLIGRLGTGKSTLAQWLTKDFWEQGRKCLYVSTEMLGTDVFAKIDSMVGKFNPLLLRSRESADGVLDTLSIVSKKARRATGEIIIPKTRLLTPAQISSFARNMAVDFIVVDGIYLLSPSSGRYSSKWEKIANVSGELKQMCLDLDVPMIGTTQIKRGASGADGYDPEDIAYSDALGQDADFVLAVYPNKVLEGRYELQLIKNRYGNQCSTQVHIDFDTMQVIEESLVSGPEVEWKEWVKRDE